MRIIKNALKTIFGKVDKSEKKRLTIVLSAILLISLSITIYDNIASTHINYMILSLNYEGAKQGLNPDGSRFSINEIKSDNVLRDAINIMGDASLSVEGVKKRISVDSKMPLSAIEKTTAAIASGSDYSYNPSEFDIYYSQKSKLGKNNTVKFLNALSKAYSNYFFDKYSEKNNILEFDATETFDDYDYYEIQRVLTDKVNSMISYLGKHQEESPTFRSSNTGYTFENLVNMLINLRDNDLEKIEAYIVQNRISKDRPGFIRKQQFMADKEKLNYDSNLQTSNIVKDALDIYDPFITGIAFIPSVDKFDEYYMSRTKTGIDNLAIKSYDKGITANVFKKKIDQRDYLSQKFSQAEEDGVGGSASVADSMISETLKYLEKLSSVALLTDDEYVSNKTKNYITFNLPEEGFSIPLIAFVKNLIVVTFVFFVAFRIYVLLLAYFKKKNPLQEIINKLNFKSEDE